VLGQRDFHSSIAAQFDALHQTSNLRYVTYNPSDHSDHISSAIGNYFK
jgi:hypothetical protein